MGTFSARLVRTISNYMGVHRSKLIRRQVPSREKKRPRVAENETSTSTSNEEKSVDESNSSSATKQTKIDEPVVKKGQPIQDPNDEPEVKLEDGYVYGPKESKFLRDTLSDRPAAASMDRAIAR